MNGHSTRRGGAIVIAWQDDDGINFFNGSSYALLDEKTLHVAIITPATARSQLVDFGMMFIVSAAASLREIFTINPVISY